MDLEKYLKEKPKNSSFKDAKYMNYPNINYSIKIK